MNVKTEDNNRPITIKDVLPRKFPGSRQLLKYFAGLVVAGVFFLALYSTTVIGASPKIDPDDIYSNLYESSVLYDDEGNILSNIYMENGNRINISYDEMPEDLINAVVAIEDKTFWEHNGFNFVRILGAIKESLFSGDGISGTSTITQQLARNVYLSDIKQVRSLSRKISEAWYTIQLEATLSKKDIMEAYLNTIYLGYNSYGVQVAAQSYFNKDAGELDLLECAALAALPKSPDAYALAKTIDGTTAADEAINLQNNTVLYENADSTVVYNGDVSGSRRNTTLDLMVEQGFISDEERDSAKAESLAEKMDLYTTEHQSASSYYRDYIVETVINDLMEKDHMSEEAAKQLVYAGGLTINTTIDSTAQDAVESAFGDMSNFPGVTGISYDDDGNILSDEGNVILYDYDDYFDEDYVFTFRDDEFRFDSEGNMILAADKRLNFYTTDVNGVTDYSIDFDPMYIIESDGSFYSIEGGTILVPAAYKTLGDNGDLIIDASFFDDYPDFFSVEGDTYSVKRGAYTLKQMVRQPQGAMVISDYTNGHIKAMIGGRDTMGQNLYNRATTPQQPGSSIKPLSIYSTALQQGADAAESGAPMDFIDYGNDQMTEGYGSYWTAASLINDAPMVMNGEVWPSNWYNDYRGQMTLRESVEQSVNVNAVRVYQQLGDEAIVEQLKNFGISTVADDSSESTNDLNPAALALGGMTEGISPLEMSAAYGTFPNEGVYTEPVVYTSVLDRTDKELLTSKPDTKEVMSDGVAFIMSDILRTTVTEGIASAGAVGTQVTAGKTGTTNDQFDVWFCGFTPQYSAALWIGNDFNIELTEGSSSAAALWASIMREATYGMDGSLPSQPSSVINVNGEYFISGTEEGVVFKSEEETIDGTFCTESGYLATPWCTSVVEESVEASDPRTQYYCPIHNQDTEKYPTEQGDPEDPWIKPEEDDPEEPVVDPEEPEEPVTPTPTT